MNIQFKGIHVVRGDETVNTFIDYEANKGKMLLLGSSEETRDNFLLSGKDLGQFAKDVLNVDISPKALEASIVNADTDTRSLIDQGMALLGRALNSLSAEEFNRKVTEWVKNRIDNHDDKDVEGKPIRHVAAIMGNFISPKYD